MSCRKATIVSAILTDFSSPSQRKHLNEPEIGGEEDHVTQHPDDIVDKEDYVAQYPDDIADEEDYVAQHPDDIADEEDYVTQHPDDIADGEDLVERPISMDDIVMSDQGDEEPASDNEGLLEFPEFSKGEGRTFMDVESH